MGLFLFGGGFFLGFFCFVCFLLKKSAFHKNAGNFHDTVMHHCNTCNGKLHVCNVLNYGKDAEYNAH